MTDWKTIDSAPFTMRTKLGFGFNHRRWMLEQELYRERSREILAEAMRRYTRMTCESGGNVG